LDRHRRRRSPERYALPDRNGAHPWDDLGKYSPSITTLSLSANLAGNLSVGKGSNCFSTIPSPSHMPNFFVFVQSFQVLPRRIALFATLLIAALALSVYQVPQQPEYSRIIYSQDISLLTELPAHRSRLDYLLLAQPLADFPHYIIKYKDQSKLRDCLITCQAECGYFY
jgi:hypothetical protein